MRLNVTGWLMAGGVVLVMTGCGQQSNPGDKAGTANERSERPLASSGQRPQQSQVQSSVYTDPKGFFTIAPPTAWTVQEYPQDPRGKVAFKDPKTGNELRVLAKATDISDIGALISNLKQKEQELGLTMNIEQTVFNGMPVVKRTSTVTMQGITRKMLWIDLLVDGYSHNIQYSSTPSGFDRGYDVAWKSIITYAPTHKQSTPGSADVKKHEVAKWLRLAQVSIESGNVSAAKEAIKVGLEVDHENQELLKLKSQINAK